MTDPLAAALAPAPKAPDPGANANETVLQHQTPADPSAPSEQIAASTHFTFALCAAVVIGFGVWSSVSTLDIVSMAQGVVIPSSQVKTIQHLEGGIIREIRVREGSKVEAGQPLVVLEPTSSTADVGELKVRLASLTADIARIEALLKDAPRPLFPEGFAEKHPDLVRQAVNRFDTRRKRRDSEVRSQQETIIQRQKEMKDIRGQIANGQQSLKLVREQISISEALLKDNLTNRFLHLDLLKESKRIEGKIESDTTLLERNQAAIAEAQANLAKIHAAYDEENQKAHDEARLSFGEFTQRISKFEDSLKRTLVRSPVEGVVKTLHVVTVGGVLRPGDPILDIVPGGDRLIVEAKLPTGDIGYVAEGQPAMIRLASSDSIRFSGLKGTVVNVSPDTIVTPEGQPFYKVRIATEGDAFKRGNTKYTLFPGMQVMASIETGTRTVLEYITDPLRQSLSTALQER